MKRAGRQPHWLQTWSLRGALLVVILAIWVYATGPGEVSALLLPSVPSVGHGLADLGKDPEVWSALGITSVEILVAATLSMTCAGLLGLLAARRRLAARTVEPLLAAAYMVPLVIFYPLFIMWFGFGVWSKIAYGAMCGFIPIAYTTLRALVTVDSRYLLVGRAFGATPAQLERQVKLGAAKPMLLAGVRIGLAINVITVLLAEMLSSNRGLGYELSVSSQLLDGPRTYALIIVIMIIVALLQTLIERATRQHGMEIQ